MTTGHLTTGHRVVVIGIGNEFRRDDGAGPAAVEQLRGRVRADVRLVVSDGEPAALLEAWTGADLAIVIDAVRGAGPAGRLYRVAAAGGVLPDLDVLGADASTHSLGLGTAVGLSRALGRMPAALIVHAIEGADFGHGQGLSPDVGAAMAGLAVAVLTDLRGQPG